MLLCCVLLCSSREELFLKLMGLMQDKNVMGLNFNVSHMLMDLYLGFFCYIVRIFYMQIS